MKQILGPIEVIQRLSGRQVFDPQVSYVLSQHCMRLDCPDGQLLYHVMTGELLLLGADETVDAHAETLVARRFLVPEDLDECAHALQTRATAALLQRNADTKTSFTILTTTDCNARCPYCYERGIPRQAMSEDVARDVADYLARASGGNEVSIHWFGGEPLHNRRAIDLICQGLDRRGVPFRSHMTSNGFYLDAATAVRAKQAWNLGHVQITLDGTEERYNRTKAYVDGQGSAFKRVQRNIDAALDAGLFVYLRLNMDAANVRDLQRLCEMLAARYAGQANLKAHVQLLRSLAAPVREFVDDDEALACYAGLIERLEAGGLAYVSKLPRKLATNHCRADSPKGEVILPDGAIAKCEHVDPTEHLGSIYDPWRDESVLAAWRVVDEPRPACQTCPLLWRCNMLARCPWWKSGCEPALQRIRRYNLERSIRAAYAQ